MTTYLIPDSFTMLRRSLRRMRRYPSLTFFTAVIPVIVLLLFVYVLGGTLGAGLGATAPIGLPADAGRDAYIAYVVPGILLITVAGIGTGTAISVSMDMTAGIIARFRTMAIARSSVLAGHVIGSVIQALLALGIVLVVATLLEAVRRKSSMVGARVAMAGSIVVIAAGSYWFVQRVFFPA